MKKRIVSFILLVAMVLSLLPTIPLSIAAAEPPVYSGLLEFSADNTGYCAVCDKTVTWTAVSGERTSDYWLQSGTHYYLSGDLTYTGSYGAIYINADAANPACLHLNGKNLSANNGGYVFTFNGDNKKANVLGSGTVTGTKDGDGYACATVNMINSGNVLNLYCGTYTKQNSNNPVVFSWGSELNLFKDATILDPGDTASATSGGVVLWNETSVVNLLGGTISGGKASNSGGNVYVRSGSFTMSDGTISGGQAVAYHGGNVYVTGGSFAMSGGTISGGSVARYGENIYISGGSATLSGGSVLQGSVCADANNVLNLTGNPKITSLTMTEGSAVNIHDLTAGASIGIGNTCTTSASEASLQSWVDSGYFVSLVPLMQVAAQGSQLVLEEIPEEIPQIPEPTYILGNVLYETDFESETVGQLPAGWSAGYSEGNAQNGTYTSFGWSNGGTMTAQVESFSSYGKAFHFTSGNNDAFAAMVQIPTTNYLYEAEVYVERGYGSFGLANNYYAPTDEATGALFSSIYPKGDSAKYTYKGTGKSGSDKWISSYSPAAGQVVKLQMLSMNGKNYFLYDGQIVAQCAARLQNQPADHPGFYTCYGGIYVLNVKVTEVFAAETTLSAKVTVSQEKAQLGMEVLFDKAQSLYKSYAGSDSSKLQFGLVLATGNTDVSADLTQDSEGGQVITFNQSNEDADKIVCTANIALSQADYETWYSVRPFLQIDGVCFYGEGSAYLPAKLANGAYFSAGETQKQQIAELFGFSSHFTAEGGKEVTFTLFSDFHYIAGMYPATISDLKTILKRADESNSSFVLSAGDFTNDMAGSPELYNTYRQYTTEEGSILPAYNVYGNHELEYGTKGNSMETVTWTLVNDEYTDHTVVWGTPDGTFQAEIGYYYFESDGFRVVCLDSEHSYNPTTGQWEHNRANSSGAPAGNLYGGSLGPVQLQWLEEVLMDAAQRDIPCIVVAHDGFSGLGWATTSPDSEAIRGLYKQANDFTPGTVLMSINGHIHTNHQGWNDGVFYFDTNTVRNNWWQDTAVDHYTDQHTFMFEEYDDAGNLIDIYPRTYGSLTMGKKTWFSEDPISCTITLSDRGTVSVDGVESDWAYDIVPTAATTVSGVECLISSGMFWNCEQWGHLEQTVLCGDQYHTVCKNTQCAYSSLRQTHNGVAVVLNENICLFPATMEDAVAAHLENSGSYIRLLTQDLLLPIPNGETVSLDTNSYRVQVSGNGTLYGTDSSATLSAAGTGSVLCVSGSNVSVLALSGDETTVVLSQDNSYTFHKLSMEITGLTLNTQTAALYYSAQYLCDPSLAAAVTDYGISYSVSHMPDRRNAGDTKSISVSMTDTAFTGNNDARTGYVSGIFKVGKANNTRGKMPIYANPYIVVGETVYVSDETTGDTVADESFDGVAYSLFDVLCYYDRDEVYETLEADRKENLNAFYTQWYAEGISAWELKNIRYTGDTEA